MKNGTIVLIGGAVVLLILGFVIPVSVGPAEDARVVIDHTKKVYSAPACFDQADLTNNLEETTLAQARQLSYLSESSCTDQELASERKPFLIAIFQ